MWWSVMAAASQRCTRIALNVTVGQAVSAGDVIAFVGSTGDSTGDHLHLEVNDNGTLKNPREYLP